MTQELIEQVIGEIKEFTKDMSLEETVAHIQTLSLPLTMEKIAEEFFNYTKE